jgi:hypothetical protein
MVTPVLVHCGMDTKAIGQITRSIARLVRSAKLIESSNPTLAKTLYDQADTLSQQLSQRIGS